MDNKMACLICVEIQKGNMSAKELRRASQEVDMDKEHREDVDYILSSMEEWEGDYDDSN